MPKGFVILEWTMEEGLVLLYKFPETLDINLDDIMRVFFAHITGKGQKEKVVVRLEGARSNISSHFTGLKSKTPYLINIILELGEDPEMYGELINEIFEKILSFLAGIRQNPINKVQTFQDLEIYLAKMFDLLNRLANLNKEQIIAQIFSSKKGREIHNRLQEGAISKKDLKSYLEENLDQIITNLDLSLDSFIQTGLIKEDWIAGFRDQFLFLLNDFEILRVPAKKIVNLAKKNRPNSITAKEYLTQVKDYFSLYAPSFNDSMKIASLLANPDKFDIIKLFSNNFYKFDKIPKNPEIGGEETRKLINELIEDKILIMISDKKSQWVMLLTDIAVNVFFPEYMIEKIQKDYKGRKIKKEMAIKHLELLEKAYTK